MNSRSHTFALFSPLVDSLITAEKKHSPPLLHITAQQGSTLLHRLNRVIRIQPQQHIILFGKKQAVTTVVQAISATSVAFCSITRTAITPLQPVINLCLPTLSKPALEQALYAATVLGVNTITLLPSEKNSLRVPSAHKQERYTRIMVAAAEQSKQLYLPTIQYVNQWHELSPISQGIFADIEGIPLTTCVQQLTHEKPYTIIIGPSNDFSTQEKVWFTQQGFLKAKLGPTVLRSEDAVMVSLGILRSLLNT